MISGADLLNHNNQPLQCVCIAFILTRDLNSITTWVGIHGEISQETEKEKREPHWNSSIRLPNPYVASAFPISQANRVIES